MVINMLMGGL